MFELTPAVPPYPHSSIAESYPPFKYFYCALIFFPLDAIYFVVSSQKKFRPKATLGKKKNNSNHHHHKKKEVTPMHCARIQMCIPFPPVALKTGV